MTSTEWKAIIAGVLIVVISAMLVALFRWLTSWVGRSIANEFRGMVESIVHELQPNGGASAVDRVVQRIDGVSAEVAYLTRQMEIANERFEEHITNAAEIVSELRGEIAANGPRELGEGD